MGFVAAIPVIVIIGKVAKRIRAIAASGRYGTRFSGTKLSLILVMNYEFLYPGDQSLLLP